MKAIRYSLFLLLSTFGLTALAQGNLIVNGLVVGANGSVPVIITVDNTTSVTVLTDPSGTFFYNTTVTADSGFVQVQVPCQGMIVDSDIQGYDQANLNLYFEFIYCDVNPIDDCDASFWAWNDSIPADSINIDPFMIYIINESTGTDISYLWDFGDGSTSTEPYPNHYYETTGQYTICLTVSSTDCEDTQCMTFSVDDAGVFNGAGAAQLGFTLNVVAEITIDVNELSSIPASVSVYPNPVNEQSVLNVNADQSFKANLQIYNTMGQQIHALQVQISKGSNSVALPQDQLSSGNYFVRLVDEAGHAVSIQIAK
ncbi:MAG: T9SS type A sorting domain-containing protein [Flavobacteriales bacterium]|nr:T9SS type A sorting domain-containing protein [Flavobacteriales bacterium]